MALDQNGFGSKWLWVKIRYPRWDGKWKQGPTPAVHIILTHTRLGLDPPNLWFSLQFPSKTNQKRLNKTKTKKIRETRQNPPPFPQPLGFPSKNPPKGRGFPPKKRTHPEPGDRYGHPVVGARSWAPGRSGPGSASQAWGGGGGGARGVGGLGGVGGVGGVGGFPFG